MVKGAIEISLRPYTGRLFFSNTRKGYEASHKVIFKTPDVLSCATEGRFGGGEGKDGLWTYLVYADSYPVLAHELVHVLFHVFQRCGIEPSDSGGEAFCYMLSQLMIDCKLGNRK